MAVADGPIRILPPRRARAVGLPLRCLAAAVDCLLPTVLLWVLIRIGGLALTAYQPAEGMLYLDLMAQRLFEQPTSLLRPLYAWLALYCGVTFTSYGLWRTTLGKRLFGLTVRQANGRVATLGRLYLRSVLSTLVVGSLGLAFLWIAVAPSRQGWHDTLSRTFVVRDLPDAGPTFQSRRKVFFPDE